MSWFYNTNEQEETKLAQLCQQAYPQSSQSTDAQPSTPSHPYFSEALFGLLCEKIYRTFSDAYPSAIELNEKLNVLYEKVITHVSLHKALWEDDFKVFRNCVQRILCAGELSTPVVLELWPSIVSQEMKKNRYSHISRFLLTQAQILLPRPSSIQGWDLELDRYERCKVISHPFSISKTWLRDILQGIQPYLKELRLFQKPLAFRLLENLAQVEWEGVLLESHLHPLREACHAIAKHHLAEVRSSYEQGWSRKILGEHYFTQVLLPNLKKELNLLLQWGSYVLTVAVTHLDEQVVVQSYLQSYQSVELKLHQWKEYLYEIRKNEEHGLRGSEEYLQWLKKVDQELLSLNKTIDEKRAEWLSDLKGRAVFHAAVVAEINDKFFMVLQSEVVQKLSWVQWVHHTCVCFRATEELMIAEMSARAAGDRYFKTSNDALDYMRQVYTMTDFAVSQLPQASSGVRKAMAPFHPDKHSSIRPSLHTVADYCYRVLSDLRGGAATLISTWSESQWADINDEAVRTYLREETEINTEAIAQPRRKIDIGVFETLHSAYLIFIDRVPSRLAKTVQSEILADKMLYTGSATDVMQAVAHHGIKLWAGQEERRCRKLSQDLDETQKASEQALGQLKSALIAFIHKKMKQPQFKKLSTGSVSEFRAGVASLIEEIQSIFDDEDTAFIKEMIEKELTTADYQAFRPLMVAQSQVDSSAAPSRAAFFVDTEQSSLTNRDVGRLGCDF